MQLEWLTSISSPSSSTSSFPTPSSVTRENVPHGRPNSTWHGSKNQEATNQYLAIVHLKWTSKHKKQQLSLLQRRSLSTSCDPIDAGRPAPQDSIFSKSFVIYSSFRISLIINQRRNTSCEWAIRYRKKFSLSFCQSMSTPAHLSWWMDGWWVRTMSHCFGSQSNTGKMCMYHHAEWWLRLPKSRQSWTCQTQDWAESGQNALTENGWEISRKRRRR